MPDGGCPSPADGTGSSWRCRTCRPVETLRGQGATFRNDIVVGVGGKQILLEDPSGNPVELFEPTRAGSGALTRARAVRPRRGSPPAIGGGYCRYGDASGTMQGMSQHRARPAGGAEHRLRLRRLPRRPGRGHRHGRRRRRRARADAHRRRQVAVLPGPGAGPRRAPAWSSRPLIALMQDQVDALAALGVRAAFLNSTQTPDERRAVEAAYLAGELDLLYLAPERLAVPSTRSQLLERGRIALFAIDEAHCVVRSGATTSAPTTSQLAMLGRALARRPADRADRDRDRGHRAPRSSTPARAARRRASSSRASTGPTSSTGSCPRTARAPSC